MSGHHPFGALTQDFTPERRRRIGALKRKLAEEMPLQEPSPGAGSDAAGSGRDTESVALRENPVGRSASTTAP